MTEKRCERCNARPPVIVKGPFAGSYHLLDYCAHCSADLCDECMKIGRCPDSEDGKHHLEDQS